MTTPRYDRVSLVLHWLTVPLIIALLVIGWLMVDMPLGLKRFDTVNLHKSLGCLVLFLSIFRVLHHWLVKPGREFGRNLPAALAHKLLYFCLLGLPLSGWLMSNAAGFNVQVFGTATLPVLLAEDAALQQSFSFAHEIFGWLLCGLLTAHVGAVIWHSLISKDDVWERMNPFS